MMKYEIFKTENLINKINNRNIKHTVHAAKTLRDGIHHKKNTQKNKYNN